MPQKDKNGLTPRQEKYARARAEGLTQRQAYKASHEGITQANKTIDENACRLERQSKVKARIDALKELTANTAALTREDIAASLADIAADTSKSDGIRLKAFDQLSRIIGAYDDRQSLDIRAAVITGEDKSTALKAYLADMVSKD
jgi:hypothetical protein